MSDPLNSIRSSIQKIDHEILNAVCQRMLLSQQIGQIKKDKNIPIKYPEIESGIKEKYLEYGANHKLSEEFCGELARIILEESVRIQENA